MAENCEEAREEITKQLNKAVVDDWAYQKEFKVRQAEEKQLQGTNWFEAKEFNSKAHPRSGSSTIQDYVWKLNVMTKSKFHVFDMTPFGHFSLKKSNCHII